MQQRLVEKVVEHAKDVASDKIDTRESLVSESTFSKATEKGAKAKPMEPAPTMPKEIKAPTEAAPAPPAEQVMSPSESTAPTAPIISEEKILMPPMGTPPTLPVQEVPTKKSPPPIPQKPTSSKTSSMSSTASTETSPKIADQEEVTKDDIEMEAPQMSAPKMPEGPPKAVVKTDNENIEARSEEPNFPPSAVALQEETKEAEILAFAPPKTPLAAPKMPLSAPTPLESKDDVVRPDIEREKVAGSIKNKEVEKFKTMSDLTGKRLSDIKGNDRDFDPVISELAKKLDIAMKGTFGSPNKADSRHELTEEEEKEEEIQDSKPLMMAKKQEMPVSAPPQTEPKTEESIIENPKEIVFAPQVITAPTTKDAEPKETKHPKPDSPTMEKKKKSFLARFFSFC